MKKQDVLFYSKPISPDEKLSLSWPIQKKGHKQANFNMLQCCIITEAPIKRKLAFETEFELWLGVLKRIFTVAIVRQGRE